MISDLAALPRDLRHASSAERQKASDDFRTRPHEAFIEVKWLHKGSPRWDDHNWTAKVKAGVPPDMERLAQHRLANRCRTAAMLVVDDTGQYWHRLHTLDLPEPAEVMLLVLHPPGEGVDLDGGDAGFWNSMAGGIDDDAWREQHLAQLRKRWAEQ